MKKDNVFQAAMRVLKKNSQLRTGVILLIVLLCIAFFAPIIAPCDPYKLYDALVAGPGTPGHILGTDGLGRDVLSEIIYGTRTSLMLSLIHISAISPEKSDRSWDWRRPQIPDRRLKSQRSARRRAWASTWSLIRSSVICSNEMCIRDSGYTVYGAERFYYNWTMYDFFEEQGMENQRDLMFLIATPSAG